MLRVISSGIMGKCLDASCWGINFELLLVGKMVREVE